MIPEDGYSRAWLATAAGILLAIGAVLNNAYVATLIIVLAAVVVLVAAVTPVPRRLALNERSLATVLVVGLALEVVALPARAPYAVPAYSIALVVLGLIGIHAVIFGGRWRWLELGIVVLGYVAVISWMIANTPIPDIDVYVFQQEGPRALLNGMDPFSMRFDVHAPPGSPYYAPQLIEDGQTTFGFIYPPVSLLLAVPGYVLAGDYRYGAAVALGGAALLIGMAGPRRVATGAALLLLFAPGAQQVLYWGWSDPFVILLLAATVLAASRAAGATPIAIGLFIASKQYVVPLYLLAVGLLRRTRLRIGLAPLAVTPVVVALLSVAPFVIWDPATFYHSTIGMHLAQPFRADSLSVPAVLYRAGFGELPSVLAFVLAGIALLAALRWAPRTTAGFCFASAFVLCVFTLFSKQAFMHYYYLVMALLLCGVASADLTGREGSTRADEQAAGLAPPRAEA